MILKNFEIQEDSFSKKSPGGSVQTQGKMFHVLTIQYYSELFLNNYSSDCVALLQQLILMSFEWIDCSFFLKKNIKNSEVTINLTPYYKLQFLNEEHQMKDINFGVRINFEKPLMYDQSMGWNWHKSWNIPDMVVELVSDNPEAEQTLKILRRLFAEIYIVKPVISKQYSLCIEDLGLEGNTCLCLNNNRAVFSGLKFSATSYNSQGSKFHFLLIIYEQNQHPDEPWKILLSKISTPVFVDSRKSAREAELIKLKKLSAFVQPFQPSLIEKRFVKKQSKKQKDYLEELIENNLQGLYNYFGAANIRNKIKHPLFLAFKFDGCFQIYINSKLFSSNEVQSKVEWVQHSLQQIYKMFQIYKPPCKIDAKKLIFLIKGKTQRSKINYQKKIVDFLQTLQNQIIQVCTQQNQIPPYFQILPINQQVLKAYNSIKIRLQKDHSMIYKNKEHQLKNHLQENSQSYEPEQKLNMNSQQQEDLSEKEKQIQVPVEDQQEQQFSDESSPESFMDQRLNIPLKCQINIDPVRKKPFKMDQIIKLHEAHKEMSTIKCEKNKSTNERQLNVLNQLMKIQIEQMKRALHTRNVQNIQMQNSVYNGMFPMNSPATIETLSSHLVPGHSVSRSNVKSQATEGFFSQGVSFGLNSPNMFKGFK